MQKSDKSSHLCVLYGDIFCVYLSVVILRAMCPLFFVQIFFRCFSMSQNGWINMNLIKLVLQERTLRPSERVTVAFLLLDPASGQASQQELSKRLRMPMKTLSRCMCRLQEMGVLAKTRDKGRITGWAVTPAHGWRLRSA